MARSDTKARRLGLVDGWRRSPPQWQMNPRPPIFRPRCLEYRTSGSETVRLGGVGMLSPSPLPVAALSLRRIGEQIRIAIINVWRLAPNGRIEAVRQL